MGMIQIDMPMPTQCDCCRFCAVEYTADNKPDSYAYCCAKEAFIAQACDGTDKVVSTAILKRQNWCPLQAQEAVKPKKVNRYFDYDDEGKPYIPETYDCGACGNELPESLWKVNYCPSCGRAVKQNG